MDNKLSKENYLNIRKCAKQRSVNLYPSYAEVLEAKKLCYPPNVKVEEAGASVPLQELLDHTTKRLLSVITHIPIQPTTYGEFIFKWGCDGSSNHSEFQQKFSSNNDAISDANLFLFSFINLKFIIKNENNNLVVWQNESYSSL